MLKLLMVEVQRKRRVPAPDERGLQVASSLGKCGEHV